jgi:hypothetical protein
MQNRLYRNEERVIAAVVDAQCRDWTADRPDRVGFARLAQVSFHLAAARRYFPIPSVLDDPVRDLLATASWTGTLLLVLLLADDPAAPLTLAGAAGAAVLVTQLMTSMLWRLRDRRARRAPMPRAPIDDRQFYSQMGAVLEDCADRIRRTRQVAREPAVAELDAARSWLRLQRQAIR